MYLKKNYYELHTKKVHFTIDLYRSVMSPYFSVFENNDKMSTPLCSYIHYKVISIIHHLVSYLRSEGLTLSFKDGNLGDMVSYYIRFKYRLLYCS